jgi:uncharacterized protein (TIGR03435 family)
MRTVHAAAVLIALVPPTIAAFVAPRTQSPATGRALAFDVASVRPSPAGAPGGISRPVNGIVRAVRTTVRQLVQYAFDIEPLQRRDPLPVGGPSWIDEERFDIEARGPADLSFPDSRLMMQALLAERFRLRVRHEPRETPVYELVLARKDGRLGRGLQPSQTDCAAYSAALAATGRGAVATKLGPGCGLTSGGAPAVAASLKIANPLPRGGQMARGTATMAELLTVITRAFDIDRKVIDRTGLTGTYDIDLGWVPPRAGAIVA